MLGALAGAGAQTKATKRAPPPKFDAKKVEQTFFADARKELKGPRPSGGTTVKHHRQHEFVVRPTL